LDPLVEDAKDAGERLGDVAGEIGDAAGEVRHELAALADQAGETFELDVKTEIDSGLDTLGDAASAVAEELDGAVDAVGEFLGDAVDVLEGLIPDHSHDQNQLPPDSLL